MNVISLYHPDEKVERTVLLFTTFRSVYDNLESQNDMVQNLKSIEPVLRKL